MKSTPSSTARRRTRARRGDRRAVPDAFAGDAHGAVAEAVDGEVAEVNLAGGGGVGGFDGSGHGVLLFALDSRIGAEGAVSRVQGTGTAFRKSKGGRFAVGTSRPGGRPLLANTQSVESGKIAGQFGVAFFDGLVDLGLVDFFDAGEGVDFGEGFVGAEAEDAGEAQGEAAGVARTAHDVVEGDFEDDERLDGAEVALIFEGVGFEEFGEVGDLGVGDAGVGFADVEEFSVGRIGAADGEGVVAEQAGALAVCRTRRR